MDFRKRIERALGKGWTERVDESDSEPNLLGPGESSIPVTLVHPLRLGITFAAFPAPEILFLLAFSVLFYAAIKDQVVRFSGQPPAGQNSSTHRTNSFLSSIRGRIGGRRVKTFICRIRPS